jgi:hypothetical protein
MVKADRFQGEVVGLRIRQELIGKLAREMAGLDIDIDYVNKRIDEVCAHLLGAMPVSYCECKEPMKCKKCRGLKWVTLTSEASASLPEDVFQDDQWRPTAPVATESAEP